MLIERLVSGGAAAQEAGFGDGRILRPAVGIVVVDLVIVPGRKAGCRRMERLKIRIGPVERVAVAIVR